jgi:hypothetical protein
MRTGVANEEKTTGVEPLKTRTVGHWIGVDNAKENMT